jgi:hypothetical protein
VLPRHAYSLVVWHCLVHIFSTSCYLTPTSTTTNLSLPYLVNTRCKGNLLLRSFLPQVPWPASGRSPTSAMFGERSNDGYGAAARPAWTYCASLSSLTTAAHLLL